ncbi:Tex family protein [Candidatus Xianfuyuplasma coldseepsis]|uniref:RNA-binding transcriptional accessory protein n=1 Tax=Candidatus Xianfuyuplasma coldseepsis TaxID=2782163 RepID=A0A7L7KQ81_9MOLU|nr:Tex family protein [Xianfuyuplasma coldseepsis]QMS84873.1 RNA-binding transcriptional accessory protein [Xianfuyuplasma coldseepsis]
MEFNNKLMNDIAANLNISRKQIKTVLEMLEEGNTVPFIARYRKEQTGALDEEQIREINKEYEYSVNLLKRKEDVIRLIDEKGLLTEELHEEIMKAEKLVDVEDLYRPFKEKKKTKATIAVKQGLKPLAEFIETFPTEGSLEEKAEEFVTEEVPTVEDAIQGALYIIAEDISDSSDYRKWIRNHTFKQGTLDSSIKKNAKDEMKIYEMYYEFSEPIRNIKLYRVLALNRAEKEKVLTVKVNINDEKIHEYLDRQVIKNKASYVVPFIKDAVRDAYKRLIGPSIEREIRSELTEKADQNAIHIFSENLRSLLLQPPMKGKMVLGVDPAYRTGCKLAVVDKMGTMQEIDVIYPHQKFPGENVSQIRRNEAGFKVTNLIKKYDIDIIAIGNGTASRETEQFIINVIKYVEKDMGKKLFYVIVNEAGASVYSASELAKDEFPKLAVEERSAVSIARRLQDPLSELVKIDPKSIGVGQYQHDVSQKNLSDSLDFVVETAVNQVGVNVNTASVQLLQYVAGLNKTVAENIVKYREKNGPFTNREQLLKVPRLGEKAYEQAVGFLRILNGDNPFDKTGIHPESYDLALRLMEELKLDYDDIGNIILKLKFANMSKMQIAKKLDAGLHTVEDIMDIFVAPLRDPRDDVEPPILRSDVLKLEDLRPGMELQGTVRNVVDFGAFVDCGVKDDGLVHISQLAKGYVKHPLDVVSVGEIVTVWVKDVDLKRHRLQLTMIKENAPYTK